MIIFSERCVNFSYSTVLLLTSKYYLKKKRVRSSVKKAANIFIITAILMVATMSQIHLWKCLINGDLLLSPGCKSEVVEQTCCSAYETTQVTTTDDKCCEKIQSAKDFTLEKVDSSLTAKERQVADISCLYLVNQKHKLHLKERFDYFNDLSPPSISEHPKQVNLQITHCSFLC